MSERQCCSCNFQTSIKYSPPDLKVILTYYVESLKGLLTRKLFIYFIWICLIPHMFLLFPQESSGCHEPDSMGPSILRGLKNPRVDLSSLGRQSHILNMLVGNHSVTENSTLASELSVHNLGSPKPRAARLYPVDRLTRSLMHANSPRMIRPRCSLYQASRPGNPVRSPC
jgi:hypothetical protein